MRRQRAGLMPSCLAVVILVATVVLGGPVAAAPLAELITVDPGDAVWTRFGHVVVRVVDPTTERDDAYSFGYAPFDQPDFIWGYLRGESMFYLARQPWTRVLARYRSYDRTVRRRPLNLTPEQAEELARRLEHNARRENRDYLYDHLRDNCSTRVRDLLDEVTGGALRRAAEARDPAATYRDYTLLAGSGRLLTQIVFDLIGGPNQEIEVDGWAQLYLPLFLEEAAAEALVEGSDGEGVRLAGPAEVVYERRGPPPLSGDLYAGRRWVAGVGLVLGLFFVVAGRVSRRRDALGAAFGRLIGLLLLPTALVFGLIGLGLTTLILVSKVPDFRWNENALVLLPTDLLWSVTAVRFFALGRRHVGRLFRAYAGLRLVALALYALAKLAGLMPQDNWAFLACAAAIVAGLLLTSQKSEVRSQKRGSRRG